MEYKNYEKRPETVEAYQWDGKFTAEVKPLDERVSEIPLAFPCMWCGAYPADGKHGMIASECGHGRFDYVCVGDYIFPPKANSLSRVMRKKEFERRYAEKK